MLSEDNEETQNRSYQEPLDDTHISDQHGLVSAQQSDPSLPLHEEHGSLGSNSDEEWSISTSPSQSASEGQETPLNLHLPTAEHVFNRLSTGSALIRHDDITTTISTTSKVDFTRNAHIQHFPEELLFHVMSHLPAPDLLRVKLVSKRFYNLVNSPHAWMNAFSKFFIGPESVHAFADANASGREVSEFRSIKRSFTRLSATTTWTSEYLQRTNLLRCLVRGRPSIPFATPSPGRPGKGTATFTFSSRLGYVSHLHASFGAILDKRKPQFIHGLDHNGTVSSSDRKGRFDAWGMYNIQQFRHFEILFPGTAQWGEGPGDLVGVPNSMDLSQPYGMFYGEGLPGGRVFYLSSEERRGRFLSPFLNLAYHEKGMPKITQEVQSTCCVWIAKSAPIPRITNGLIGAFSGSSSGVVSAYSLGPIGHSDQRRSRGELTARWLLSPGVPIIAITADDCFSEARLTEGRVWAVALNALGEVFYLQGSPRQASVIQGHQYPEDLEIEIRAWQTGSSLQWRIIQSSWRTERPYRIDSQHSKLYLPSIVCGKEVSENKVSEFPFLESWISKTPIEIKAEFDGWAMRRRLDVDFAADDNHTSGEVVIVTDCGFCNTGSAAVKKYTRIAHEKPQAPREPEEHTATSRESLVSEGPTWSFDRIAQTTESKASESTNAPLDTSLRSTAIEIAGSTPGMDSSDWRCSDFSFGRNKKIKVQVTAIDQSLFSLSTCAEDRLKSFHREDNGRRVQTTNLGGNIDHDPLNYPGQRARFFAVGTNSGSIFVWNARAGNLSQSTLVHTVEPLRVIHTQSVSITSLALSALYLVHGGSEGLVQAWDPLASTLEPMRTLSSRSTLNARRRAVIAAQNNPDAPSIASYAASAIALDPDPTVLRGVVAIGWCLRYWSYSSAGAADEAMKLSQQKLKRSARGLGGNAGDVYAGTRRLGLKNFVQEELHSRAIDLKQQRAEEKQYRRDSERFGINLLGPNASEEELIAYAKMVSEEDHQVQLRRANEAKLGPGASVEEIEAYKSLLSQEDHARWDFASWDERYKMSTSNSTTTPQTSVSATPAKHAYSEAGDLEKALRLSMEEQPTASSGSPTLNQHATQPDDDLATAIQLSLDDNMSSSYRPGSGSMSLADQDFAFAVKLSLQDNPSTPPSTFGSPVPVGRRVTDHTLDDEEFPALGTPTGSPPTPGMRRRSKGKGREGHW